MLEDLTLPQYDGWVAYLRRYNLFPDRNDLLWGLLTATVANQWSSGGSRVRPEDVMPYYDQFAEEITADELAVRVLGCIW